jgi:CheY-like chemotaxis protein/HPt (histidine-containing phosphotransfer) domain-containing protein
VLTLRSADARLLPVPVSEKLAGLREAAARIRAAPAVSQAQSEGTLVLVVDDHPVNRALLARQLETLGYASEAAHDGEQALQLWRSGRFSLVLSDCQMPGMDGYELARRIRAEEVARGQRRIPVIACTAMALEGEVPACMAAGMDECLFKPVELATLRKTLGRWLPLPQTHVRSGVLDLDFLKGSWGSDPVTVRSILDAYARSLREDSDALREAAGRSDMPDVMRVSHRMLGASRMVGAGPFAEACELVNAASRGAKPESVGAAMEAFEQEYTRLVLEMEMNP